MGLVEFLVPMIKGGFFLIFLTILIFVFYQLFKVLGIVALIKSLFKQKVDEDIYDEVADMIADGKTFQDFAESISKYSKRKQEKYIQAYLDIQNELNKKEGDNNGKQRKTKRDSK